MTRRKQNGCHDPNLEQYRAQTMMYTNTKICLPQEKLNYLPVDVINKHTICQLKNIFLSRAESREIDCDETI